MFQNNLNQIRIRIGMRHCLVTGLIISLLALFLAPNVESQYQPRKPAGVRSQASITVTGPATGTTWEKGKRHEITWNSDGIRGAVKIDLIDSKGIATNLVRQTTNNGKYSFSLKQNIADGAYKIRVSSTDGKTIGESSGTVTITKIAGATKKTAIAGVNQPAGAVQQTGVAGKVDEAKPTYEPRVTGQVSAGQSGGYTPATGTAGTIGETQGDDSRPSVQRGVASAGTASAGAATNTPGASVSSQSAVNAEPNVAVSNEVLYQHEQGNASELGTVILPDAVTGVASQGTPGEENSGWWGAAGNASQNAGQSQQLGNISILSPTGGELWETEQVQTISWEGENTTNAKVELLREGASPVTLSNSSGNATSITYTPPPRAATGNNIFWVRVTTPDGNARATSPEPFSVWSGVPVDLMCGIRNFGGGVETNNRGWFKQPRHTRYVEFEIWIINKGSQFIEHLPFVVRVIKHPENLRLEYFEAGFTNVDARMWLNTIDPVRFDIETWKGNHSNANVMWESGTYVIELEADPRNTFGESDSYRLDNKVSITFVID